MDYKIEAKGKDTVVVRFPEPSICTNEEIAQLITRIEHLESTELLHTKLLIGIIKRITYVSLAASLGLFFAFLEIGHVAGWI